MVPRENKNNAYAEIWGTIKEYYGIFRKGLFHVAHTNPVIAYFAKIIEHEQDGTIMNRHN